MSYGLIVAPGPVRPVAHLAARPADPERDRDYHGRALTPDYTAIVRLGDALTGEVKRGTPRGLDPEMAVARRLRYEGGRAVGPWRPGGAPIYLRQRAVRDYWQRTVYIADGTRVRVGIEYRLAAPEGPWTPT